MAKANYRLLPKWKGFRTFDRLPRDGRSCCCPRPMNFRCCDSNGSGVFARAETGDTMTNPEAALLADGYQEFFEPVENVNAYNLWCTCFEYYSLQKTDGRYEAFFGSEELGNYYSASFACNYPFALLTIWTDSSTRKRELYCDGQKIWTDDPYNTYSFLFYGNFVVIRETGTDNHCVFYRSAKIYGGPIVGQYSYSPIIVANGDQLGIAIKQETSSIYAVRVFFKNESEWTGEAYGSATSCMNARGLYIFCACDDPRGAYNVAHDGIVKLVEQMEGAAPNGASKTVGARGGYVVRGVFYSPASVGTTYPEELIYIDGTKKNYARTKARLITSTSNNYNNKYCLVIERGDHPSNWLWAPDVSYELLYEGNIIDSGSLESDTNTVMVGGDIGTSTNPDSEYGLLTISEQSTTDVQVKTQYFYKGKRRYEWAHAYTIGDYWAPSRKIGERYLLLKELLPEGGYSAFIKSFWEGIEKPSFELPGTIDSAELHGDYCVASIGTSTVLLYRGELITTEFDTYSYQFCGGFLYRQYQKNNENWVEVFEGEKIFDGRYASCSCCGGRFVVREYGNASEIVVFDPEFGKMRFNSDFRRVA